MTTDLQKKVSIRVIDPKQAQALLSRNASNQRPLRPGDVKKYAADMVNGEWLDDVSAITLDVNGNVTNGQHRLHAVIQSGTTQSFIFAENWPSEAMLMMDQGNKRSQLDRITVMGVPMSKGADSIVRHSMTSWSATQAGGTTLNRRGSDHRVIAVYKKHADFIEFILAKYKNSATLSPLTLGCALHAFAQASVSYSQGKLQCDPIERIIRFLDIVSEGPVMESYNPATDAQAVVLREWIQFIKHQNRRPVDGQFYRIMVSNIYRFMKGKCTRDATRTLAACPWGPIEVLPGTNLD